jgi:hypothetical protein
LLVWFSFVIFGVFELGLMPGYKGIIMSVREDMAKENFKALAENSYPGRGIVCGLTPDGKNRVQVYWIMGRSSNSRNRVFLADENLQVRTKAYDESKLEDPSLIIYYPVRTEGNAHVVTNGDQTDTIVEALAAGKSFSDALFTREYEPDGPNFTPRISAMMEADGGTAYAMSILKTQQNQEDAGCARHFFYYEKAMPGLGHCITTYEGDGNPLPSFPGEPYLLPISGDLEACADEYWNALDADNKVSMLVKWIDVESGEVKLTIRNRHQ